MASKEMQERGKRWAQNVADALVQEQPAGPFSLGTEDADAITDEGKEEITAAARREWMRIVVAYAGVLAAFDALDCAITERTMLREMFLDNLTAHEVLDLTDAVGYALDELDSLRQMMAEYEADEAR